MSATGPTDQIASYSNFGRAIDVAAPGGDFNGNPLTSLVLSPCSTLTLIPALAACQANGNYLFLDGTSMATPHASGVAALLDAQYGGALNGGQLKSRLQQTADDLGKPGADSLYGHGRVNAHAAAMR